MKLFLLALLILFSVALGLFLIADAEDTQNSTVDLYWFWEYQDWLATYAYNTCLSVNPEDGKYSCRNMILTRNAENGGWNKDRMSGKNKNWTRDYWFCQLNSTYHRDFISSPEFVDPYKQLDYCLSVRLDAKRKWSMPRYAYKHRYTRDKGIVFNNGEVKQEEVKQQESIQEEVRQEEVKITKYILVRKTKIAVSKKLFNS